MAPRLLLINPWIYDFTAFDLWSKPVGLLYIAAYLRKLGYEIDFLDCLDKYHPDVLQRQGRTAPKVRRYGTGSFYREIVEKPAVLNFIPRHFARYGLPEEIFLKELHQRPRPDAVLVTSFMTYWYPGPKRVVELVRQVWPGVPVILGGIYATLMPEHAREVVQPDYLITGPGEVQVAQLLKSLLPDAPDPEPLPRSLDDFPPPAFDLIRHPDYYIVMTSRGCPFRCTFCATHKISGPYTRRQPQKVVEEIVEQTRRLRVRDVAFYDDALLLHKTHHFLPIMHSLMEHKRLNLRFHTPNGLHVRQIDEEVAAVFFRAGFRTIRLSFESVSADRLQDMRNKVTPDDLERAVQHLEAAGYPRKKLEAYVLMGLPEQPLEEVYQSILFVHSLGIQVRLASFSPIPGTVDYQRAVERGLFPADADPLLTNKSVYPLYRTTEAYWRFHQIRQLVIVLNQGVERGVNLLSPREFREAFFRIAELRGNEG